MFFCIAGLFEAVLLVELVHAAAGIDELLLAGVERVALGADFNRDVLLGGTGLNHVAAFQSALSVRRLAVSLQGFNVASKLKKENIWHVIVDRQ